MATKTEKHSMDDYSRALLRSAISSANRSFNNIMNDYFPDVFLDMQDGYPCWTPASKYNYIRSFNTYSASNKFLNDAFFYNISDVHGMYSSMSATHLSIMTSIYNYLSNPTDMVGRIKDERAEYKVEIPMDKVVKDVILAHNDWGWEINHRTSEYLNDHPEIVEKYGDRKTAFKPTYRELYKQYSPEEKEYIFNKVQCPNGTTDILSRFIDVLDNHSGSSRMTDFMDTYTLYHYYIYRRSINAYFRSFVVNNPGATHYNYKQAFLRGVCNAISDTCQSKPCVENKFFNMNLINVAPTSIANAKAKTLTLDLSDMGRGVIKAVAANIEKVINVSAPSTTPLVIENISITSDDRLPMIGCILKSQDPVVPFGKKFTGNFRTKVDTTMETPTPTKTPNNNNGNNNNKNSSDYYQPSIFDFIK